MTTSPPRPVPLPLPFVIRNRTLFSVTSQDGVMTSFSLEELRDRLRRIAQLQDPTDHARTLDQLHVDFTSGRMEAFWLGPNGVPEEPRYLVTQTGAQHVASKVLPSRFFPGLRELATLSPKLAALVWRTFATRPALDPDESGTELGLNPALVRTVRMKISEKELRWVIRSCHSSGYAEYSNLAFVEDILSNAGQFAHLPVLDVRVTDNGMRVRLAGLDLSMSAFMHFDPSLLLSEPIPMIEAWNSETGQSKTVLRGGLFRLDTLCGVGHWDKRTEHGWIHRGSSDRIRAQVEDAFRSLFLTAAEVVEAYKQAQDIPVENAFVWLEQELRKQGFSEALIREAQAALSESTTTPGGKLASVVDAVTLAGSQQDDVFEQHEVEKLAGYLLHKGRDIALKNPNGHVPVKA